ncbi:MAG: hypothetical protein EZS28_039201, partial [Streblomastix strix]
MGGCISKSKKLPPPEEDLPPPDEPPPDDGPPPDDQENAEQQPEDQDQQNNDDQNQDAGVNWNTGDHDGQEQWNPETAENMGDEYQGNDNNEYQDGE